MSTASVSVFGNFNWDGMTNVAGNRPCYEVYCWPWHIRVIATLLTACALLTSIVYECRTRDGEYFSPDNDDKVVIMPVFDDEDDDDEEYEEYGAAV